MALVNVRRDVTDAFYRYKMEKIQTKIEGKGNGIKTVVINLSSVARSLARPGSYVIKYFGFELGAQTNIDPPDDRWIINGAHDAPKLQDYLDGFINKFVLCKKCKNPETDVVVKDHIVLDCKACGQRTDVDLRLKLSGFILKNQPKKGGKKDKAERKAARKAKQQQQANGNGENGHASGSDEKSNDGSNSNNEKPDDDDDIGSDDEFTRRITADAQVIAAAEAKEDEWAVDMSEEAIKARQNQLPEEFRQKLGLGAAANDDDEDGEGGDTVYDALGEWVLAEVEKAGSVNKVDDVQAYVKAKELGIEGKHKTVMVLAQTLFNESVVAQIPKRAGLFKQLVTSERHERSLLGGIERLLAQLGKENPDMLSSDKIVKILHQLYDKDLVSEEVVTKWGTKASKKYVDLSTSKKIRRGAEPFLKWLEEAESDDSEDDDE